MGAGGMGGEGLQGEAGRSENEEVVRLVGAHRQSGRQAVRQASRQSR